MERQGILISGCGLYDNICGGGRISRKSTKQLIRRANELLKQRAKIVEEFQKLKLEVLGIRLELQKRNREQ